MFVFFFHNCNKINKNITYNYSYTCILYIFTVQGLEEIECCFFLLKIDIKQGYTHIANISSYSVYLYSYNI